MMMKSVIVSIPAMKTGMKNIETMNNTQSQACVQLGRDSAYKGVV